MGPFFPTLAGPGCPRCPWEHPTHPAPTSSSLLLSPLLPFFFFFLSSSFFFSFSGMMLSIQARSCWEKTKSSSRLTRIRAKI